MKRTLLVLGIMMSVNVCLSQTTSVPDNNFEHYLETHNAAGTAVPVGDPNSMGDGTDGNNLVLTNRIDTVQSLNVSGLSIADLTGIEGFLSLSDLNCSNNQIAMLDLQSNLFLTNFNCSNNGMNSLIFASSPPLGGMTSLNCSANQLTALDVSNMPNLQTLNYSENQISNLDLSSNPDLETLNCSGNQLADTDTALTSVTNNLKNLYCFDNTILTLDLTSKSNLVELACYNNGMTSLTLPTTASSLTTVNCYTNALTGTIDFTSFAASLTNVDCSENQLTGVNVTGCTLLESLAVEINDLTNLDVSTCSGLQYLECGTNDMSSGVLTLPSTTTNLEELYAYEMNISALNYASYTALTDLDLSSNNFSSLDISTMPNLTSFYCNDNALTTLNIKNGQNGILAFMHAANNTGLTCIQVDNVTGANAKTTAGDWQKDSFVFYSLDAGCTGTPVTTISDVNFEHYLETHDKDGNIVPVGDASSLGDGSDGNGVVYTDQLETALTIYAIASSITSLSGIEVCTDLQTLDCTANQITTLDLSSNTNLVSLNCTDNSISSLTLPTTAASLTTLNLENNNINGSLNLSTFTALETVDVSNSGITGINVSGLSNLTVLEVDNNNLSALNVSDNGALEELYCNNNTLGANLTLPLTKTNLVVLDASEIGASSLNYALYTNLNELYLAGNSFTDINDVSALTQLTDLDCSDNSLTSLDVSANANLGIFVCSGNALGTNLNLPTNTSNLYHLGASDISTSSLNYANYPNLQTLYLSENNFTDIDISGLTNIQELYCDMNQLLTSLNIKNGTNNATLNVMEANNNSSLSCIEVDDVTVAEGKVFWVKDASVSYSTDCSTLSVNEADSNKLSLYPNPSSDKIYVQLPAPASYRLINIYGQEVSKGAFVQGKNTLDVQSLAKGVYFLKTETNKGGAIKKIIKE
ncbi:leucine-rich repeat domain-containing protein [Tamlana sp. I1]|uniref:T9SS type A sorting domain-containing protein n=1 Tax=Tamlana sp. I1 TaxID=2762061 RepID=UPI00188EE28C|nr:leucine-rich repeat domain-containing protein [Tamlana sp. I1]